MGGFVDLNVYDDGEIEGLNGKQLRKLSKDVRKALKESPEIRQILRKKTRDTYEGFSKGKSGAAKTSGRKA